MYVYMCVMETITFAESGPKKQVSTKDTGSSIWILLDNVWVFVCLLPCSVLSQ